MLCGKHYALNRNRQPVTVPESYLRLCVRSQPGQLPTAPHFGLAAHQPVRIQNGRGHSFGCFIRCVTEHHPLIAGTQHAIAAVHSLADVLRLPVKPNLNLAAPGVDASFRTRIAGFAQHFADQRFSF